jgi:hypothetical protein
MAKGVVEQLEETFGHNACRVGDPGTARSLLPAPTAYLHFSPRPQPSSLLPLGWSQLQLIVHLRHCKTSHGGEGLGMRGRAKGGWGQLAERDTVLTSQLHRPVAPRSARRVISIRSFVIPSDLSNHRAAKNVVKPRIISNKGPQFIANDFKPFLRFAGLTHHVPTSPYHPQTSARMHSDIRRMRSINSQTQPSPNPTPR